MASSSSSSAAVSSKNKNKKKRKNHHVDEHGFILPSKTPSELVHKTHTQTHT
jgi:hypothetical protein